VSRDHITVYRVHIYREPTKLLSTSLAWSLQAVRRRVVTRVEIKNYTSLVHQVLSSKASTYLAPRFKALLAPSAPSGPPQVKSVFRAKLVTDLLHLQQLGRVLKQFTGQSARSRNQLTRIQELTENTHVVVRLQTAAS